MKRIGRILLSILLLVPMFVGMCFLSPSVASTNSLDSPKTKENNPQGQVWENPTYKTYEDYFTDLNITTETITANDLTGNGTALNPYLVRSIRGFLYITNYSVSGINLESKYIELCCDIVLNDETFDKEGNPSGGDGVVYEWASVPGKINFNGNGHTIKGMRGSSSLFQTTNLRICNIILKDIYVESSSFWAAGLVMNVQPKALIENCQVQGNIRVLENKMTAGGIAGVVNNEATIRNCENHANIYAQKFYYGGIAGTGGIIENCRNYGTIDGLGVASYMGGIASGAAKIVDCVNYGEVTNGNFSGGITNNASLVQDCSNYGYVTGAWSIGGIASSGRVYRCKNYGKIFSNGSLTAGIVADTNLDIYYCENYGVVDSNNASGVGGIVATFKGGRIAFCKNFGLVAGGRGIAGRTENNTEIYSCENYGRLSSANNKNRIAQFGNGKLTIRNCIVDCKYQDVSVRVVYIDDLSYMSYNYKTGKILFTKSNANSFYMKKVTEEMLEEKGFTVYLGAYTE